MFSKVIIVVLGLVSLGHVCNAVAAPAVTGTYYPPSQPGVCNVTMKAFGWEDTATNGDVLSAYIIVNGLTYVNTPKLDWTYRGFILVVLDPLICKASTFDAFDTHGDAGSSTRLFNYLNAIPDGAHVLGVVHHGVILTLQPNAKTALMTVLGVNTSILVEQFDKLLFHAVKGSPDKVIVRSSKRATDQLYFTEMTAACNFCQNGGVLKVTDTGNTFKCICPAKYTGTYCEKFTVSCDVCDNGGNLRVNTAKTGFECQCPVGVSGFFCENKAI